jgi:glycosyltransferase involved in cell wall biosynthesis
MKILLVITKAVVGGAQTSVLNLARELKKRGHEVEVGFGEGDWLPRELELEKIPYTRFQWLKRTHNPLANLFFIGEMRRFLRGKDFTAVHFNSSNALAGAIGVKLASRKIKTVFTFRGMSMLDEHFQISPLVRSFYFLFFKSLLGFIDAPVFVSQENLAKFGQGQLTDKGKLVYNGLDPAKINFAASEEAIRFFSRQCGQDLSGKYIIGSIGRLDYQKNYEFLIKIFPKILEIRPDAVAVIMGEGDERGSYEGLIKENKLEDRIFLLGNIENGSRYLKGFDLFVLPSRYEGLSIALIEALFAGLFMLVSDVGGNRETVGSQEQEVYDFDDETEFLARFEDLQDVSRWPELAKKTAEQAAQFNLRRTADGYEKIYQEK